MERCVQQKQNAVVPFAESSAPARLHNPSDDTDKSWDDGDVTESVLRRFPSTLRNRIQGLIPSLHHDDSKKDTNPRHGNLSATRTGAFAMVSTTNPMLTLPIP